MKIKKFQTKLTASVTAQAGDLGGLQISSTPRGTLGYCDLAGGHTAVDGDKKCQEKISKCSIPFE